jgi:hypothetical protein
MTALPCLRVDEIAFLLRLTVAIEERIVVMRTRSSPGKSRKTCFPLDLVLGPTRSRQLLGPTHTRQERGERQRASDRVHEAQRAKTLLAIVGENQLQERRDN